MDERAGGFVRVEAAFTLRNQIVEAFFARESERLAAASKQMAERFRRGGRLLAFGRGPWSTDAQHVAVEFVHPVIVGKRALPALDLSLAFAPMVRALVQPDDMVVAFGGGLLDEEVTQTLQSARSAGAMTFALDGADAAYAVPAPSSDPFVCQETIEVLYHTLWETVHVFLERQELGHDVGAAGFLYPFLGREQGSSDSTETGVAESIRLKAGDDSALREQVAREQGDAILELARVIRASVDRGGRLLLFGNGGSATDAIDCLAPPAGYTPVPAISLASDPAVFSAVANDVGTEVAFVRPLLAHARPADIAIALSTSGSSCNVVAALAQARKRGLQTAALLGSDGGEIARGGLVDLAVTVPTDYIPRIQEVHASIYHTVRDLLERGHHG